MRRPRAWLAAALLLVGAAACSRCGKAAAPAAAAATPIERLLPRGAVAVLVVPKVQQLGEALRLVEGFKAAAFAAQLQGFPEGKAFVDSVVAELGVDLRDAALLAKAGLDGARGLGVVVLVSGEAYLVVPVLDEKRLHFALETLAHRRLGAGAAGEQKVGEVTVKTFARAAGGPPLVGYTLRDGYALVATDAAVGRLASLVALPESDSLAADPVLRASRGRAPKELDAFAFVPHGSPLLAKAPATSALVTVRLAPEAFTVAVDAPWKQGPEATALFTGQRSAPLWGYLPQDAFFVARFAGDAERLAPFLGEVMGPYLAKAFADGDFNPRTEVLPNLEPGAVVAVSLAERPPLAAGVPELDIRHTNPFTWVHLSGLVRVKRPEAVVPTIDKVAGLAPRFGAEMKKLERRSAPAWFTTYAQGEGVHLAFQDGRLLFGSPSARVDAMLDSDGKGPPPVAGLTEDAVSAVLDLRKLTAAVRGLPESAWGIGGFAMKGATVRWLDAIDDLVAISVTATSKDAAVQARVVLSREVKKGAPR